MKALISIGLISILSLSAHAQIERSKNLAGKFSGKDRRFHFGFTLGYNKASFDYRLTPDFTFEDSLMSMYVESAPGFNLGIVTCMHIDNNWKLKFIPAISFQDRNMKYRFLDENGTVQSIDHRVESTFLDFPIMFKWRTNRINNFCLYLIGGGQYSIDMATRSDVIGAAPIVKIKRNDYSAQIGGGIDFFLPYFKFGIELRNSVGIPNVNIPEDNILSSPISSLRTRLWLLSFTFEG